MGTQFQFRNEYGKQVRATINPSNPNQVMVETLETANEWSQLQATYDAVHAGRQAGRTAQLNRGVGGASTPALTQH